jgi:hypothetical protein
MTTQPFIAYDPAARLVYGVGRSEAEARDDAEFQAAVVVGHTAPWTSLETRPCSIRAALLVDASNGPARLDDVERAA